MKNIQAIQINTRKMIRNRLRSEQGNNKIRGEFRKLNVDARTAKLSKTGKNKAIDLFIITSKQKGGARDRILAKTNTMFPGKSASVLSVHRYIPKGGKKRGEIK